MYEQPLRLIAPHQTHQIREFEFVRFIEVCKCTTNVKQAAQNRRKQFKLRRFDFTTWEEGLLGCCREHQGFEQIGWVPRQEFQLQTHNRTSISDDISKKQIRKHMNEQATTI